ncbi:MAG: hypothetical protein AB4040_08495 [Synechococcus sp.]
MTHPSFVAKGLSPLRVAGMADRFEIQCNRIQSFGGWIANELPRRKRQGS